VREQTGMAGWTGHKRKERNDVKAAKRSDTVMEKSVKRDDRMLGWTPLNGSPRKG